MSAASDPRPAAAPHRGLLPVLGAVAVGLLTAIQSRINGALGRALDDGIVAAVISFGSGLATVAVLVAVLPSGRAAVGRLARGVRDRSIPWWLLIGGAAGALTVGSQGIVVGVIGTAAFTVGVVAGQTLSGLVLDRIGYSPAGVTAVTVRRVVGVALALGAVGFSLTGGTLGRVPLWMLLLPVGVGIGLAWQQATNGRLQRRTESAMAATLVNFAVGTLVLGATALMRMPQTHLDPLPADPLLYLGGVLGVVYIALSAAIAPRIGVLLLSLGSVLGMLVGSFVLDLLWPPAVPPSPLASGITVAIACVGVAIAVSRPRVR
ncbi:DMT family transporter [Microbacterium sp. NPDC096154]|uniref:DMT family transporter n=1 Tax=Microbacterium sp. NPDC096154 TaxID=3155549 RepID=UPI003317A884